MGRIRLGQSFGVNIFYETFKRHSNQFRYIIDFNFKIVAFTLLLKILTSDCRLGLGVAKPLWNGRLKSYLKNCQEENY